MPPVLPVDPVPFDPPEFTPPGFWSTEFEPPASSLLPVFRGCLTLGPVESVGLEEIGSTKMMSMSGTSALAGTRYSERSAFRYRPVRTSMMVRSISAIAMP